MNWNNLELPDKNIYFKDDDSLIFGIEIKEKYCEMAKNRLTQSVMRKEI